MKSHAKFMHHFVTPSGLSKTTLALLLSIGMTASANAAPTDQAKRIHDRLVGTPPSQETLMVMQSQIEQQTPLEAAYTAMEDKNFYNISIKEFATPWTNEAQSVHAPLNDYSATIVGIVRDDRPFTDALTADLVYTGANGVVNTPYSHNDNRHYEELEDQQIDLSDPQLLVSTQQSLLPDNPLPANATAGVLTTRASAEAFIQAGTNRRAWRYLSMNYLCRDMEQLHDITRSPDRIRQDVSRSPGGDSSIFLNKCIGCHSGMDAVAGAFAYYEYDQETERLIYTANQVQEKHLINAGVFPTGYTTSDDSWVNYWRRGHNQTLLWDASLPGQGNGVKSLGQEVTSSRAFAECQVEKVFSKVCLRPPSNFQDRTEVQRITNVFQTNNFSLKRVFAETAVYCMGE